MNVLEIANYSAPYAGNFILSLLNLENKINKGNMVYLFPLATKEISYARELKNVFYLTSNLIEDTKLINDIIKKFDIQVIHSHFTSSKQNFAIMMAILFKPNIRYIKHEHGEVKKISGYRKKIRQFLRSKVDVFIPCNYPIQLQLIEDDVQEKKIKTITNAIDFKRLDKFEKIEIENNNIQILMFGSDWYRKGGDIAIKAIAKMQNITLNIALSSGLELVKELIIKDFGNIPDFVNFLSPRNDIASYYKMADVFISPSRSEGLPYSIIEAMYCETLVIVSDIKPQQNIVSNEYMFQSENYEELISKINYVMEIENKQAIKNELRKLAIDNYNLDNWSEKVMAIYQG